MKRSLIIQLIGSQLHLEDDNRVLGMHSAVERTVQILEELQIIDVANWEPESSEKILIQKESGIDG